MPRIRPVAEVACALGLALMPFATVGNVTLRGVAVQLMDLVWLPAAALWLLAVLRGEVRPRLGAAHVALAGYVAAALLSLTATPSLAMSAVKLVALGYLISIFVMTHSLADEERGLRRVLGGFLVGVALTGLAGCLSVLLFYLGVRDPATNFLLWNYGSVPVGAYPRVAVFFANANMTCSYLLVGIAAVALAWPLFKDWPRRRGLLLAVGAMACVTAVFTLSTGLGGLALGGAVAIVALRRRRGLLDVAVGAAGLAAAAGFAVITVFLLVPRGTGDVRLGPVDLQLATSGRVSVWGSALTTWERHPLTGAGLGVNVSSTSHPRAIYSTEHLAEAATAPPRTIQMEAHNIWLNILGQIGPLGLATFVAFMGLLLRGQRGWPGVIIVAAFVGAVFYHGFFAALEEGRQLWFLFGLAYHGSRGVRADHGLHAPHGEGLAGRGLDARGEAGAAERLQAGLRRRPQRLQGHGLQLLSQGPRRSAAPTRAWPRASDSDSSPAAISA